MTGRAESPLITNSAALTVTALVGSRQGGLLNAREGGDTASSREGSRNVRRHALREILKWVLVGAFENFVFADHGTRPSPRTTQSRAKGRIIAETPLALAQLIVSSIGLTK